MRKKIALLLGPCLVLGACNQGPEVHEENASVGEVAEKVRAATGGAQFIRAGEWKSTGTIEEMSIPGMSAEDSARMKQAMAKSGIHEFSTCLTEQDVKQPEGKFFTGNDAYFSAGSRLSAGTVICESPTNPMNRATTTAWPAVFPTVTWPSSETVAISFSFELKSASAVTSRTEPSE